MSGATETEKAEAKAALKARSDAMAVKEKKLNEGRTGKGLRVMLGMTRGRNPQEIQYEAFDDSQADTLPTSTDEFLSLTKTTDEKTIVSYLVEGFNSLAYSAASDPISEFLNPAWDDETTKQFRIVVRNYSGATGVSIEDAVALIKPGIDKAFSAKSETVPA